LQALLLYCRAGFEKECAADMQEQGRALGAEGYIKAKPDSGFVLFTPHEPAAMAALCKGFRFERLVFARQAVFVAPQLNGLPADDRVAPLLEAARALAGGFSDVFLETADTNDAKAMSVFVRQFAGPFGRALAQAGLTGPGVKASAPRLHLFFLSSASVFLGLSRRGNSSPWLMGIPRLKFPRFAPSRSTLKLEEAFLHFLGDDQAKALLPGMKAVDLGAAPGGWTWQLAKRSIRVTAVDNGPMDAGLLESGLVEHLRADGFRYRPPKSVDWLVCDMAEQPSRIAELVARWLAEGWCGRAVFNLKLPMKKRYEEVRHCRELIEDKLDRAEVPFRLAFRQLYHDREEVTGYLVRLGR
jgi:23S rRNA (cytidine2498-2'-O)-methyltransferase